MRLSWSQPEDLIAHELVQSESEGKDVTAVAEAWRAAGGDVRPARSGASDEPASPELRRLAARLLDELDDIRTPTNNAEPDDCDTLPAVESVLRSAVPSVEDDRFRGAWFGRAAGCLLGKPVEKIPPEGIREILVSQDRWPLDDYFTGVGLDPAITARWPWNRASRTTSLVENIDGMPEDDDLNYTMLNLQTLEVHGVGFTVDDVAQSWLLSLPAGRVFTAERSAYRNLLLGLDPGACATRWNPFREWIGALIRADVFGWVLPGDAAGAARLALVDASLSHRRNGVYGAMWAAALASAALVAGSVDEVVAQALSVVPPESRLAKAVRFGDELARSGLGLDESLRALWAEFEGLHWVHVLNNAATIAWAIRRGGGRFEHSVPLAVMAGWDTDSDAATVGAVCGALHGLTGIPRRWTDPLRDRIATSLPGLNGVTISSLAARTEMVARRVNAVNDTKEGEGA